MFFGKNKTHTEELIKAKFNISFSINSYQLRVLLANLVDIEYNDDNLETLTNKLIDEMIDWGGKEFREEIEEQSKKTSKDFYHFILNDEKYGIFLNQENEYRISVLNIDREKNNNVYDALETSGQKNFLEEKNIFLDKRDINVLFYIKKVNFGFFDLLFKNKFNNQGNPYLIYKNFLIKNYEIKDSEREFHNIFCDFCNNFNQKLLMDIQFDFQSLEIAYDGNIYYGQPFDIPNFITQSTLLNFKVQKVITYFENNERKNEEKIREDMIDRNIISPKNLIEGKVGFYSLENEKNQKIYEFWTKYGIFQIDISS